MLSNLNVLQKPRFCPPQPGNRIKVTGFTHEPKAPDRASHEPSRESARSPTETVLLGNIAIRAGKRLEWDAARMRFANHPDANKYLEEPYQNGWSLEKI